MSNVNLNTSALDKLKLDDLDQYIESLPNAEESLIHVLHHAQKLFGYLPHNVQLYVARKVGISAAKVNGVVSFYSFFIEEKPGKHNIAVCMGTACYVKGAEQVLKTFLDTLEIKKGQVTPDGMFKVSDVRCIGACGLAPVVTVGEKVYGYATKDLALEIIEKYRGEENGN